jgi:hypothetical protein
MKNLLKFLLIGGSIICVFSIILGSCSTTKRTNPCKECPQYTEIPNDMTYIPVPLTTNTFINLNKI